ncbi:uncharacterized protein EV422DRAFT_584382 [Fimicolochytrium jonesii]|uniref:uncharacterized protein n=1 Tax=Fimicolochytrium jonesii TaxID=1396493 RepID=UPI0022FE63B0|nr:uncharacterized protein EV422DRAFT_584382 [Fimicolochytrium jonesii]KAI8824102.1 hypothetical protein EV422DRAFT_584382 [Fimicolochytrium jonesii]
MAPATSATDPAPSSGESSTAGASRPAPVLPLTQRLSKLVISAQFLWFLGHLTTVIQTLVYVLYARFASTDGGAKAYAKAYYGTLLSYGIIMFKAHGNPQISMGYLTNVLRDENSWYFLSALYWVTSKPLVATLFPYVTFSLFHSLNYIRSDVLPALLPPSTSSITPKIRDTILRLVKTYQHTALRYVAYVEVWTIMPVVTIGVLFGWTSFFAPLMYARFLMFRYHSSPLTEQAFVELRQKLDATASDPRVPAIVKKFYEGARDAVIKSGAVPTAPAPQ